MTINDEDHELMQRVLEAINPTTLVELTPEIISGMAENVKKRNADIALRYPKLVAECPYETKLAVTAWVFEHLVAHAHTSEGTFRYLIYNRLGFDADAYLPLYNAGGMLISNQFDLTTENDR